MEENIYLAKDRPLPQALLAVIEFNELSEAQRKNFAARLRYIEEITLEISDWLDHRENEVDLRTFFDQIELLLYATIGSPAGESKERVSAYLVHSSWTFDTSAREMVRAISGMVTSAINAPPPRIDDDESTFMQWMECQNKALAEALNGFYEGADIHQAMAGLLAVDALLTSLLAGAIRFRLAG
jgi:hypothetical protein